MVKKKSSKPTVKAVATAKAEIVAKAIYQRKRVISEVIPPDVVRARSSAWLDLVSPLTEWAGLKGDELKLRRAQLRLQREDVLAEIVRRAHNRLEASTAELKPIQNKFLVPFLEKASLEDGASSLIDIWAGLLVSAAEGGSSQHIHFVNIISQISQKQGELFSALVHTKSERVLGLAMDVIRELESHSVKETIASAIDGIAIGDHSDFEPIATKIVDRMNCIGLEVVYGDIGIGHKQNYIEMKFDNQDIYTDDLEIDFSILEAVGLIRRVEANFEVGKIYSISLIYYHLTSMGYYFAKACGIVRNLGSVDTIEFNASSMIFHFEDGRIINVPIALFPKLQSASYDQRQSYFITRISVQWEKLEEEIQIERLLEISESNRS